MEGIAIISGVLSVIMIVTFFNMASRLKEIRDELFRLRSVATNFKATPSYWGDQYRAAKLLGDKQGMIKSLNMFVYYKVKQVSLNEKPSELNWVALFQSGRKVSLSKHKIKINKQK